ncbi:type II toxin-antitoxin system RelE/ParE family toxin [Tepidicaulis sp. LMO-SS28]|uniref:type II toxin-antitoxin system RelE/ParE family toxin n=1 Tax=Tepidicaulis sp. LMO-SS28 TaxID=3447455 RepID=UPI003EE23878
MTKYIRVDIKRSLEFRGSARDELRAFPAGPKREAGTELQRVQAGMEPRDWKPMKSVGAGVREIRIKDHSGAFRVIYTANIGDTVYMLHAFQKKSQKTPKRNLDLAEQRFKELRQEIKARKPSK